MNNITTPKVFVPRFAICTALPMELAACLAVCNSPEKIFSASAEDNNQYWLGTIPSLNGGTPHQVLLTSLVKMGNNPAAITITNLIRSYSTVEYILMVGIAGGIPDIENPEIHVRLGDIVVSNEKGVLQYDQTKQSADHIEIRDTSTKPSASLIAAAKSLEVEFLLGQHQWEVHLVKGLQIMEELERPSQSTDVLHDPHDQLKIVPHPLDPRRDRRPESPKVHLAAIASANTLLKDPKRRDKLKKDFGVRAIEMEGSGTADASWNAGREYIVIRGICDYCDTYKNDTWQPYAALVAASYARALIENMPFRSPRHRNEADPLTNQNFLKSPVHSTITQLATQEEFEKLRVELGETYTQKLESIRQMRERGEIESAWGALSADLETFEGSSMPQAVKARFYYLAARWAQEDGKPADLATRYHQASTRLDPGLDDRTYLAFKASAEKRLNDAINILRPFDSEPVAISLFKYILELSNGLHADEYLEYLKTPITDEIRRFLSLCRLASGNSNGAWEALEPTLPQQQNSALFLLTAGYIAFWQAIPASFHQTGMLSPQMFQPGLISLDGESKQRMCDALSYLERSLALINASPDNGLLNVAVGAYFAVSLNLPELHKDAIGKAKATLKEKPVAVEPVLFLMLLDADYDWTCTLETLTASCEKDHPSLPDIDLLTELQAYTGQAEVAWNNLLRFEHRYMEPNDRVRWLDRAIRSLDILGRLSELETRVAGAGDGAACRRIKALYWYRCNEISRSLAIAEDLAQNPGDRLDLINLVHVFRLEKMWDEVVITAECCLRRFMDASSDIVDALVQSLMELGNPDAALAVLQKYKPYFDRDGRLNRYYFGCMAAFSETGQYQQAWEVSEPLWEQRADEQLLLHRAHLQIQLGNITRALEMLKQGVENNFKTPQIMMTIAHYSLVHDREEAFWWAKKAVEQFPHDSRLRASAMHIGFNTGHGDWASMQLAILRNNFPDSGLFQEVSPPNMLELLQDRRAQASRNQHLFLAGKLPVHLWVDSFHGQLGAEFYWRWHFNRKRHLPSGHEPFPVSYGGRPAESVLSAWEGKTLCMDYTACLMAHLLKLFPMLDAAFTDIYIPPCLLRVVHGEIHQLAQAQIDMLESAEQLLNFAKNNGATLLAEPDLENGDFFGLQHADRVQWWLAEQHNLWIVQDQFVTEVFGTGTIPEEMQKMRLSSLDVLTAMKEMGELALEEVLPEKLKGQIPNPDMVEQLVEGTRLLVDRSFLELLRESNGLEAAARIFRLHCSNEICVQLRSEIEGYRYRQKIKDWLFELLAELKSLQRQGKLKMLTLRSSRKDIDADGPLSRVLRELFLGTQSISHPVWIEDRLIGSYSNIAQHTPIINVHDVLFALRSRALITEGKFCESFRLLLRAGIGCRLPSSDYLMCELVGATTDKITGILKENLHLIRLRETASSMLGTGSILSKEPVRPEIMPEETQFRFEIHRLITETMVKIWRAEHLDEHRRAAMADWLYDRFLPHRGRPVSWELNQEDPIKGLAAEHSLRMSLPWRFIGEPRVTHVYYRWLFSRVNPAWQHHPLLRKSAISHFADLVISQLKGLHKLGNREFATAWFTEPLQFLPNDVLEELIAHPSLEPVLRDYFPVGIQIHELSLFIPWDEWRRLTSACVKNGPGKSETATIQDRKISLKFIAGNGISDKISVSGKSAKGENFDISLMSPYCRLENLEVTHRISWLNEIKRAGILDETQATQWRGKLEDDDITDAVVSLRDICERSATFFFAHAGLALTIHDLSEHNMNVILPNFPEIFESIPHLGDKIDSESILLFPNKGGEQPELEYLSCLAALPYGPPCNFATVADHMLSSGQIQKEKLLSILSDFSRCHSNPVVFQNLLATTLQLTGENAREQTESLLQRLLTQDPESATQMSFDIYIELLHLVWCHFKITPQFMDYPYGKRTKWSYIYADQMLAGLLRNRQSNQIGYMRTVLRNVKTISRKLKENINPLKNADDIVDVTLPSAASYWRTVLGGTLGVMKQNAASLQESKQQVIELIEPLVDACRKLDGSKTRGFEFLHVTDFPKDPYNSPLNNQAWVIAEELLAKLTGEEPALEPPPLHFWRAAIEKGDIGFLAGYFSYLAHHPVPVDLIESLISLLERVTKEYPFKQENIKLFMGIAAVLGRLEGASVSDLRTILLSHAIKALKNDPSLWLDDCELVIQAYRFDKPVQRTDHLISTLEKISKALKRDSREFGEFSAFLRRIEAYVPPDIWPRLWSITAS